MVTHHVQQCLTFAVLLYIRRTNKGKSDEIKSSRYKHGLCVVCKDVEELVRMNDVQKIRKKKMDN